MALKLFKFTPAQELRNRADAANILPELLTPERLQKALTAAADQGEYCMVFPNAALGDAQQRQYLSDELRAANYRVENLQPFGGCILHGHI